MTAVDRPRARNPFPRQHTSLVVVGLLLSTALAARAQTGTNGAEWRTYGGDLGSTRYAPLDQIDAGNFNDLEVAWEFETAGIGPGTD